MLHHSLPITWYRLSSSQGSTAAAANVGAIGVNLIDGFVNVTILSVVLSGFGPVIAVHALAQFVGSSCILKRLYQLGMYITMVSNRLPRYIR